MGCPASGSFLGHFGCIWFLNSFCVKWIFLKHSERSQLSGLGFIFTHPSAFYWIEMFSLYFLSYISISASPVMIAYAWSIKCMGRRLFNKTWDVFSLRMSLSYRMWDRVTQWGPCQSLRFLQGPVRGCFVSLLHLKITTTDPLPKDPWEWWYQAGCFSPLDPRRKRGISTSYLK